MATEYRERRNAAVLQWLRAGVYMAATLGALHVMPFYPKAAAPLLALTVGVLGIFSPGIGVLAFVVTISLPVMAMDAITGGLLLVIGFVAVQYFAQDEAKAFVVIVLAFMTVRMGVVWAVIAIGGYVFGAAEGAVAAVIACMALEFAGVLLGKPALGVVATGGTKEYVVASLDALKALEDPLKFGWLLPALKHVQPGRFMGALVHARHPLLLAAQPIIWAGAAALGGTLRRPADDPKRPLLGLAAVAASILALALGSIVAVVALGGEVDTSLMITATMVSMVVALGVTAVWEWGFPPMPKLEQEPARRASRAGVGAEDADVDELLSLIASAEEELASKHTTEAVVMITDMKSFSKMTEEEGSVTSAKLIQRHRDLLLPVIQKHGGAGKSTGGDGLVASFKMATDALAAAVEMQRTLAAFNASKPDERELQIRMGIATGEVVLDKGGRPFIGAALNLAARVMNLGDGGQTMTVEDVVNDTERGLFRVHSHGRFELKNIAHPVEVYEVLWDDGQKPRMSAAPRGD